MNIYVFVNSFICIHRTRERENEREEERETAARAVRRARSGPCARHCGLREMGREIEKERATYVHM